MSEPTGNPVTVGNDIEHSPGQWAFKYDPNTRQLSLVVEIAIMTQEAQPKIVMKEYKSLIDPESIPGLINWLATVKSAIDKPNPVSN